MSNKTNGRNKSNYIPNKKNSFQYVSHDGQNFIKNNQKQNLSEFKSQYKMTLNNPVKRKHKYMPSNIDNMPVQIKHLPNTRSKYITSNENKLIVESRLRLMSEIFPEREPVKLKKFTFGDFKTEKDDNGLYKVTAYRHNKPKNKTTQDFLDKIKQKRNPTPKNTFLPKE